MQPDDALASVPPPEAHAQEEDAARRGAGPPRRPEEARRVPAGGEGPPPPPGLRRRERRDDVDDAGLRPGPDRPAGAGRGPRRLADCHPDLRPARERGDGPDGLRGGGRWAAFETYAEDVLVPSLRRGDVVVWDNLRVHKSTAAVAAVEAAGASVLPPPPWSPDLDPIEDMSSKIENSMRSTAARTTEAVYAALGSALQGVTAEDARGWFQSRAAYAT